ncbi:TrkA-related ion transporter [Thalassolituus sp. LLYu03]|uniref:TrkA-related ion transporter n=1 Tax=Thalassolituus sp. LLYu03 TaxID=3421656 RepID=UPI003D281F06
MSHHIVVINAPAYNGDVYFKRLIQQIRDNRANSKTPIVLLNNNYPNGLSYDLEVPGVRLVHGNPARMEDMMRAGVAEAEHILVLARDELEQDSDSVCFDLCYRLKELGLAYRIIVECVDDQNRDRFRRIGVRSVIRPIRSYPEILVRSMESPGAELVMEDMFTRDNDLMMRFPLWLEGDHWRDVVTAMVMANMGTPLAWVSKEGKVHVHPAGDERVYAQSILMLVKSAAAPTDAAVKEAFRLYLNHRHAG